MTTTESSLRTEVTGLLQELIRLDTVNPPGNETQAADLLRDYLGDHGVESELYARTPERANLVARIRGRGDGPSLLLLSHTDTVPADPGEWLANPWSGEIRDGELWGRGALDMKGQVAAEAVALASLAREGFEPAGDLVFAACADEEVGAGFGLQWLCRSHPEAVRTDYALNEGAGERLELFGRPFYLCSAAEKMSSPFRLFVRGRAGHASVPGIADNALVKAAPLIERLAAYRPELRLGPETSAMIEAMIGEALSPEEALERAHERDELAAELLAPLLSLTLSPTMISASQTRNVIPHLCTVDVDCRLLPGQTQAEVEPILRDVLGEGDFEFGWLEGWGGTRSELGTPLWDAVASFVDRIEPEAALLPVCVAGFTDSHWLRDAFGTVAYGFCPSRAMDPQLASRLIHSADERAAIDDLELAVDCFRHAAVEVTGDG
jgi:acetylornithine deacetylase/succinyl-diaminopimelate desuccinylase-like protein